MEENIKFTLAIDKINKKIAFLNIEIIQNPDNTELQNELNTLLKDKDLLFKGSPDIVKELINKYGNKE